MKHDTVFWDVDTQFDFMQPQGALYVPGAETIIEKVSETRRLALDNGCSIIADVDWHTAENPEISDTPDFKETFPAHCMADRPGAERVGYLGELPIGYIQIEKMSTEALRKLIRKDQFHIVIRKEQLDVFENPNTAEIVELISPRKVVVFGVALDFCVYFVVKGLSGLSGIEVCVLSDVTKGLGVRLDDEVFDEFKRMGVKIAKLTDFRRSLECG